MREEFSDEELAQLAEAGFVMNGDGDMVLPTVASMAPSKDGALFQLEWAEAKPATGVVRAIPGNVESLLSLLKSR